VHREEVATRIDAGGEVEPGREVIRDAGGRIETRARGVREPGGRGDAAHREELAIAGRELEIEARGERDDTGRRTAYEAVGHVGEELHHRIVVDVEALLAVQRGEADAGAEQ